MYATSVAILFLFVFSLPGSPSAHEHQASGDEIMGTRYPFRRELHPRYTLYWNFNVSARTVQFAVRVQTRGWVGFGLSPNGQMPGSDVIIGWVNSQGVFFHVRETIILHGYNYNNNYYYSTVYSPALLGERMHFSESSPLLH